MRGLPSDDVPAELAGYVGELRSRTVEAIGAELVGIYLFGSVALRAWRPEGSDLDVAVVARDEGLSRDRLERLARSLDAGRLPVPARKLELVVYDLARVRAGDPAFALNLNTGEGPTSVDYESASVPRFWFVLDVAIGRDRALAIEGPPATEVFAPPSEDLVRAAIGEAMAWQRASPDRAGAVLAAARAWHHRATGAWTDKHTAAAWAQDRLRRDDPDLCAVVADAAGGKSGPAGVRVPPAALEALIGRALDG